MVNSIKTVFARWHYWSIAREQLCLLLRVTFEEKRQTPVVGAECDGLSELLSYLEELDGDETYYAMGPDSLFHNSYQN